MPVVPPLDGSTTGKYVREGNDKNYLELDSDGTFYYQKTNEGLHGQYKIRGDEITLTFADAEACKGKIKGNTLMFPTKGDAYVKGEWTKK